MQQNENRTVTADAGNDIRELTTHDLQRVSGGSMSILMAGILQMLESTSKNVIANIR